ncbi:hypothetical protein CRG98_041966 [Punica granatum]|uniref:Uncharacterized protein n=1 Tax=Punica granatum TaxID=22663 RepID=A0A2I0I1F7_PUNGR|nr:hypothetical protein CRG98_041966 [Punica granatum]
MGLALAMLLPPIAARHVTTYKLNFDAHDRSGALPPSTLSSSRAQQARFGPASLCYARRQRRKTISKALRLLPDRRSTEPYDGLGEWEARSIVARGSKF